MSDTSTTQHKKDLAYWRGRVDEHLESMNTRLELLEVRIESFHKDAVDTPAPVGEVFFMLCWRNIAHLLASCAVC